MANQRFTTSSSRWMDIHLTLNCDTGGPLLCSDVIHSNSELQIVEALDKCLGDAVVDGPAHQVLNAHSRCPAHSDCSERSSKPKPERVVLHLCLYQCLVVQKCLNPAMRSHDSRKAAFAARRIVFEPRTWSASDGKELDGHRRSFRLKPVQLGLHQDHGLEKVNSRWSPTCRSI